MLELQLSVTMDRAVKGLAINQMVKSGQIKSTEVVTVLTGLIISTARYFNLGMNISEDQAIETAFLLMEKYGYESIQDFVMMFRKAKMGEYGKTFNRIDGQVIFEWMGMYMEEKAAYRERLHRKKKNSSILGFSLMETINNTSKGVKSLEKPKNGPNSESLEVDPSVGFSALKVAVLGGDEKAAIQAIKNKTVLPDIVKQDEEKFRKFKQDYIKSKINQE
jgi:hypothetical protein